MKATAKMLLLNFFLPGGNSSAQGVIDVFGKHPKNAYFSDTRQKMTLTLLRQSPPRAAWRSTILYGGKQLGDHRNRRGPYKYDENRWENEQH